MTDCVCPNTVIKVTNKMIQNNKGFVLHESIIPSTYWREACTVHSNVKIADVTWRLRWLFHYHGNTQTTFKNLLLLGMSHAHTSVGSSGILTIWTQSHQTCIVTLIMFSTMTSMLILKLCKGKKERSLLFFKSFALITMIFSFRSKKDSR